MSKVWEDDETRFIQKLDDAADSHQANEWGIASYDIVRDDDTSIITHVSIVGFGFTKIPDEINSIDTLRALVCNSCTWNEFPNICNHPSLRTLALEHIRLDWGLPSSIGDLTTLTDLNMYDSDIIELPETISNLTNLVSLRADLCKLSYITPQLGLCYRLKYISLRHNKLDSLPSEGIFKLPFLRIVNLIGNNFNDHDKNLIKQSSERYRFATENEFDLFI